MGKQVYKSNNLILYEQIIDRFKFKTYMFLYSIKCVFYHRLYCCIFETMMNILKMNCAWDIDQTLLFFNMIDTYHKKLALGSVLLTSICIFIQNPFYNDNTVPSHHDPEGNRINLFSLSTYSLRPVMQSILVFLWQIKKMRKWRMYPYLISCLVIILLILWQTENN
jgi:hypothetical protein